MKARIKATGKEILVEPYGDALVEELKRNEDAYAECRKLDAINTASVCENMTKIQKELQKKDDNTNIQQ